MPVEMKIKTHLYMLHVGKVTWSWPWILWIGALTLMLSAISVEGGRRLGGGAVEEGAYLIFVRVLFTDSASAMCLAPSALRVLSSKLPRSIRLSRKQGIKGR